MGPVSGIVLVEAEAELVEALTKEDLHKLFLKEYGDKLVKNVNPNGKLPKIKLRSIKLDNPAGKKLFNTYYKPWLEKHKAKAAKEKEKALKLKEKEKAQKKPEPKKSTKPAKSEKPESKSTVKPKPLKVDKVPPAKAKKHKKAYEAAGKAMLTAMHLKGEELKRFKNQEQNKLKWLTQAQKSTLVSYTGSAYSSINKGLRNPPPGELTQKLIDRLDAAFASENATVKESFKVTRGMNECSVTRKLEAGELKVGSILKDSAYQSTTLKEKGVGNWGNTKYFWHITVPPGAKALYVQPISSYPGEEEVLLNRNSQLMITAITKQKFSVKIEATVVV